MQIFQYVDEYISYKNFRSKSTKRLYKLALAQFEVYNKKIDIKLIDDNFSDYINAFEDSLKDKYSRASITSFVKVIQNYMRYLEEKGYIEAFTSDVNTIDDNIVNEEDIISIEELNKLLSYLHSEEDYQNEFLINVAFYTGLKAKYLCKVKYSDFMINEKQELYFINKIMKISPFNIKMPDKLCELYSFLYHQNEKSGTGNAYVFINKKGNVYTDRYIRAIFQNVCKKAKIKHYTASCFRHSAVYYYVLNNNNSIDELSMVFNWTRDNYNRMYKKLIADKIHENKSE